MFTTKEIIYTIPEGGGPVSIANQFGGTGWTNQFGYYYYYDGDTPELTLQYKINAKKIVIMDRAEPEYNIKIKDGGTTKSLNEYDGTGLQLPKMKNSYLTGESFDGKVYTGDELIIGTKYNLVYFDGADGPTFKFPEGIHIGFFIKNLSQSYGPWEDATHDLYKKTEATSNNIMYSDPELNRYYVLFSFIVRD